MKKSPKLRFFIHPIKSETCVKNEGIRELVHWKRFSATPILDRSNKVDLHFESDSGLLVIFRKLTFRKRGKSPGMVAKWFKAR